MGIYTQLETYKRKSFKCETLKEIIAGFDHNLTKEMVDIRQYLLKRKAAGIND